jgi:ADP-ribose pyrophosphatase YjhB (NUDIX family)
VIIGCVTLVPLNPLWPGDYRTLAAIQCSKGRGIILPGGKWEEGELFEQTAFREFREETGQELCGLPKLFYQGYCEKENYCYTFLGSISQYNYFNITDEGETRWASWSDLLQSHFKAYYSLLRQHVENQGFYTGNN